MAHSQDIYQDFKNKKISLLFWQYALPAIIGTIVNTLYNIIDGIFIGHWIGREALSAAGLILPVMNLAAGIGMLVGIGSASRISIFLGRGENDNAEKVAGTSFMLTAVLSGITLSLLLYFVDPVLRFVGSSPVNHTYAKEFLEIFLPGSIFTTLTFNYNNMMRASGYPFKAMVTMFVSVIANIILAPIFIIGLGWGMRGAALATTLSMLISFIFVMQHFLSKNSNIKLYRRNFTLNFQYVKAILSIGMSPFAMQVAASIVVVFINWQLNHYASSAHQSGDDAIAAYSNANRLITLIIMIVIGINQGMQPIIGYNYGSKNYIRVKQTFIYAVKVATAVTTFGFLLGFFIPDILVRAFSSEKDLVDLSALALRYTTLAFAFVGFQMVTTSFFQCIGMAKISILLSLSRQILILLPALYILPLFFGFDGVWAASPTADLLSTGTAYLVLFWYFRSIKNRQCLND
ncbi:MULTISPECIES: MATE family efflux transporter [unclassified Gilliamella]|uniref:MATE family efflux transporter n=1 Tax=unclassified Gilliamella TaxID=2685620 RepID=UPI00226A15DE|nr:MULTISPECIES: MATE family efflux transporter [unclassified Gilliamella]MCX8600857.1 MATE family efflux transporter [Gilliamella sp. B3722]MCX8609018.1 MATE family efflux transporter [Gilliamella sp. B3771]MCX8610077.1 MATE family efflux transporter [Gilliamella sp. B3891]MCX8612663.1 MATE family efflux transporter [Gilliamella sp. B3773]MCX8616689.1 MATE family efflux transporter [Gilliamella sp. B3770]